MAKERIIVSNGVKGDFDKSEYYRTKITRAEANMLRGSFLNSWYEFALKRGWTEAKTVSEYVEKEHGAIYTAVFMILN